MWKDIQLLHPKYGKKYRKQKKQLLGAKWQVGMGDNIKLRDPLWYKPHNETTLLEYRLDKGIVQDLMDPKTGNWKAELIAYIYDSRVAREIINTPHSKFGVPDKILWSRSKKGKYKVDEGYKLITMEQDGIANHGMNGMDRKNLWKLKIPYKICMFLWKLLHNGLSTRMELIRRQIMVSPKCVMCDQEDETLDYLFLKCPFDRALWFVSSYTLRSDAISSVQQWLITTLEKCRAGNGLEDKVLKDISATLWVIWTNRNKFIFENKTTDV